MTSAILRRCTCSCSEGQLNFSMLSLSVLYPCSHAKVYTPVAKMSFRGPKRLSKTTCLAELPSEQAVCILHHLHHATIHFRLTVASCTAVVLHLCTSLPITKGVAKSLGVTIGVSRRSTCSAAYHTYTGLLCANAGVGNVLGNKGGVGVALTYMKHTRLLFVNAHFAAHDHKVAQRQADYLRIKAGLFNSKEEPGVSLLLPPCCHCCTGSCC